jgi:hypothetical protein
VEGAKIVPEDGSSMVHPKRQQNSPKVPTPEKINITSTMNLGYSIRLGSQVRRVSSLDRSHNDPVFPGQ